MTQPATKLKDPTMSDILKQASDENVKPAMLRNEKFLDPRTAPTLEAMIKHIREYKRIDLKELLPSKYWDKIVHLGPPDVEGDLVEQTGNAAVVYFWCNFVRTIANDGLTDDHKRKLEEAERAERVNIDRFSELAKSRFKKGKS